MPGTDSKSTDEASPGQRRVLIFGTFGPPALAFARSCRDLGVETYLLEFGSGDRIFKRYSTALAGQQTVADSCLGHPAGLDAISKYAEEIGATEIVSVSESNLLWITENRARFEPRFKVLAPSHDCLTQLASKTTQIELARNSGFEVLDTWFLCEVEDCAQIPEDAFPICIRPSVPSEVRPVFKAQVCHTRAEISAFVDRCETISAPIIAQPFLVLPDLKVHGARAESGEILAMRPFLVERKFEGVTLTLMTNEFPKGVEEACVRFANNAQLSGAFHFDLLYSLSTDSVYYLEVNARMGGITDKAGVFGYDQPKLILQAYGVPHHCSEFAKPTTRKRVVTKKSIIKHILAAGKGKLTELDYPLRGRLDAILLSVRDLVTARDSVFSWRDLRGYLWYMFQRPR